MTGWPVSHVGAEKAIITTDLVTEPQVTFCFHAVSKGGAVVIAGLNRLEINNIQLPASVMTLFKTTVKGSLFGDCNPTTDEGYDDLLAGKNVRGVLVHEGA